LKDETSLIDSIRKKIETISDIPNGDFFQNKLLGWHTSTYSLRNFTTEFTKRPTKTKNLTLLKMFSEYYWYETVKEV